MHQLQWLLTLQNSTYPLLAADPGLWAPPSLETCLILGLGVFLGSVVMGITGFGTAILHLSTWAIAGALGFESGPLKLAVITCGCGMTVSMLPMFFLADATTHAIKPLAIAIPLGKAIAAPLGAALLKFLPARHLESMVSALMVLIIGLMNRQTLHQWGTAGWHWLTQLTVLDAKASCTSASGCSSSAAQGDWGRAAGPLWEPSLTAPESPLSRLPQEAEEDHISLPLLQQGHSPRSDGQHRPLSDVCSVDERRTSFCSSDEEDARPLLLGHQQPDPDGVIIIEGGASEVVGHDPSSQQVQQGQVIRPSSSQASLAHDEATLLRHGFWGLFAIGAVTGLAAGFLTGATGIGGPPMMVMYAYLDVSKAAVRGTNAVMSLVQDQIIGYIVFGLIRWEDRFAYLAGATAGLTGCLAGHSVQKLMNQKQFSKVMTFLLFVCFCLMTASAAGWIAVE